MHGKARIIIRRAGMHHIPTLDLRELRADFYCPSETLRKDFAENAKDCGVFYNSESGKRITETIHIGEGTYDFYGAIYDFNGTVDEFLLRFSAIDVSGNVKRCSVCKEWFVSPPREFYLHYLGHIKEVQEKFRQESFDYYFGPE